MENENTYQNLLAIVSSANKEDASSVYNNMNGEMASRIHQALEDKKKFLADNLLNNVEIEEATFNPVIDRDAERRSVRSDAKFGGIVGGVATGAYQIGKGIKNRKQWKKMTKKQRAMAIAKGAGKTALGATVGAVGLAKSGTRQRDIGRGYDISRDRGDLTKLHYTTKDQARKIAYLQSTR